MKYKCKPRDRHGSIAGSIAGKVNAAMNSNKWMSVDEIAKKAGIKRSSVQRRLQDGRIKGIYEYKRIIEFRLKK